MIADSNKCWPKDAPKGVFLRLIAILRAGRINSADLVCTAFKALLKRFSKYPSFG